jgi:hypothetical protein
VARTFLFAGAGLLLVVHEDTPSKRPVLPAVVREPLAVPHPEVWEALWAAYPVHRRTSYVAARRQWIETMVPGTDPYAVLRALAEHALSDQWTKNGGTFIPSLVTWLRDRRWEHRLEPEYVNPHA